ncbi:hypothetical protein EC912_102626 [Luteibacter rhizovicinus]|uniref:Xanthomonadin biosynthesis membrane protein n=1 Tax=Luteibacter rhizovicinus TaxID=242606 RepID=A0A4R3YV19_9GAMM|nr:xanthomonadin biosynthesis protein [Luteibacter rhizovicinus]TCV96276.1 hypothetical protein EC912_102626 [Luteibacter rhizovicinus]
MSVERARPDAGNPASPSVLPASQAAPGRSWMIACVATYAVLAFAGAMTHRQWLSLLAMLSLLTAVLFPALLARRTPAYIAWPVLAAVLVWLAARGWLTTSMDALPALINLAIAWLFGRTLLRGHQPLIAYFIATIEGGDRLALPGVARYARGLTVFWTGLLAVQALLLSLVFCFAAPEGLLATLGVAVPIRLEGGIFMAYAHVGCYLVIAAAFLVEYPVRRVLLRDVPHVGPVDMATQLALRWPELLSNWRRGGP